MAQMPDKFTFKLKASPRSMEHLEKSVREIKTNLDALQQSVYEAQEALADIQFVVETAREEEEADGGQPEGNSV